MSGAVTWNSAVFITALPNVSIRWTPHGFVEVPQNSVNRGVA